MEIIIGREAEVRRLYCSVDGQVFFVGQAESVPLSVSRKHCKITIKGSSMNIENLNDRNKTYVDGNQVFSKSITATSKIQLGKDKYLMPFQEVLQMAQAIAAGGGDVVEGKKGDIYKKGENVSEGGAKTDPPTFSLLPLKPVWEEYEAKMLKIQNDAAKKANQQRVQGIISMCGMAFGLLPIPIFFRAACVVIALAMAIYFFIRGRNTQSVQQQIYDLNQEYIHKYKCPNPKCGKPFGNSPYHLIEFNKQCFACGCKYTH